MALRLAVVTPFFNPQGSQVRVANHAKFSLRMQQLGVDRFTVEGCVRGQKSALSGDPLWRGWVGTIRDVDMFWHKESLINLGVQKLPPVYDAVVWADADLLPVEDDWPDKVRAALEKHKLVQAWSTLTSVDKNGRRESFSGKSDWRTRSLAAVNAERSHVTTNVIDGAPGGILAMRRDLFNRMAGLYDKGIAGGGDMLLMFAAYGYYVDVSMHQLSVPLAADVRRWGDRVFETVDRDVGFVDAEVLHLWHGDVAYRQYQTRYRVLRSEGYDPRIHVARDEFGMLRWSDRATDAMKASMRDYIFGRHES